VPSQRIVRLPPKQPRARRTLDMSCRVEGCPNRSRGPRAGFICETHRAQLSPQEQLEARRFGRLRRRRLLSRFSIQSKLVLMMVLCTIIAATVVGLIAFQAGRSSLRSAVFNRLTEVRESQSRALGSEFKDLKNSLVLYSHGAIAVPAIQAFIAGFDQLADASKADTNPKTRQEKINKAMQRLHDEVHTIPLHLQVIPWASRSNVQVVHRPDNFMMATWVTIN